MHPQKLDPRRLFEQQIRYEIPDFQRRYVWKQDEQWEPLWDDVENLAQAIVDGGRKVHFMGAIVIQQLPSPTLAIRRNIVVDGQQRLVTLQLLINAIQEVLEDRKHASALPILLANDKAYTDGKPDRAFKVWPTPVDREAFRHVMNKDLSAADYAKSRVVRAHEYFKRKSGGWLGSFQTSQERDKAASALAIAVGTGLEIVHIELGQSDDPHIIFETLNARGTPLLQSDMVKNKILHDAGIPLSDDDREASKPAEQRVWPFAHDWWTERIGRGLQRRPRIDVYLNHWLTLRTRMEMKPYDEFRAFAKYAGELTGKGDTIQNVAEDMGKLGSTYREVEQLRREDIRRFIERRDTMGVGVITPLLLWLLDANLPPDKLANCLKALESFLVRRVVCRYSARSYGSLFVALIKKLADSPNNADRTVVSHLDEQTAQAARWPGDRELHDSFLKAPLYQYLSTPRLRLVLEGIEEEVRTNKAESGQARGTLQIEHVMPQAWPDKWPLQGDVDGYEEARATRERAIHTIGNLTLVNRDLNSAMSNAPWDQKRNYLRDHSVLFLNKWLVNDGPDVWDESGIAKRGQWLYETALKIWPHSSDFGPAD